MASQSRGEVTGVGFLADSGLEAQADREGAMAARGESLYGGAVAPLSSASPAAMSGPMQARKEEQPQEKQPKGDIEMLYYEHPEYQEKGFRLLANTAKSTISNWWDSFTDLFSSKKAHVHRDWMTWPQKYYWNKKMDDDMAGMEDPDNWDDILNADKDNEVRDEEDNIEEKNEENIDEENDEYIDEENIDEEKLDEEE